MFINQNKKLGKGTLKKKVLVYLFLIFSFSSIALSSQTSPREIQPKPGSGKRPIKKKVEKFVPPHIKREPFVKPPLPKSRGKEIYEAKVIAKFTSILRYNLKNINPDNYPYSLNIEQGGETGGIVGGPGEMDIDVNGNIYIMDGYRNFPDRNWLKVYSKEGTYLKTIRLKWGGVGFYVDVTSQRIYVFETGHMGPFVNKECCNSVEKYHTFYYSLMEYDFHGNLLNQKWLCSDMPIPARYLRLFVLEEKIYINGYEYKLDRECLRLNRISGIPIRTSNGIIFITKSGDNFVIEDRKGNKTTVPIPLSLGIKKITGYFARSIIGMDKYGCLYLYKPGRIFKIDKKGEVVSEIYDIPYGKDNYKADKWVVDSDGNLYCLTSWISRIGVGGELIKFYKKGGRK